MALLCSYTRPGLRQNQPHLGIPALGMMDQSSILSIPSISSTSSISSISLHPFTLVFPKPVPQAVRSSPKVRDRHVNPGALCSDGIWARNGTWSSRWKIFPRAATPGQQFCSASTGIISVHNKSLQFCSLTCQLEHPPQPRA